MSFGPPTIPPLPPTGELRLMFARQRRAFLTACWLIGAQPGTRGAQLWKRCRGRAFAAWRELTAGQRRQALAAFTAEGAP